MIKNLKFIFFSLFFINTQLEYSILTNENFELIKNTLSPELNERDQLIISRKKLDNFLLCFSEVTTKNVYEKFKQQEQPKQLFKSEEKFFREVSIREQELEKQAEILEKQVKMWRISASVIMSLLISSIFLSIEHYKRNKA